MILITSWEEAWKDENRDFLALLADYSGVPLDHPKFRACWALAWQHGHSAGISEVVDYFDEFAELLR